MIRFRIFNGLQTSLFLPSLHFPITHFVSPTHSGCVIKVSSIHKVAYRVQCFTLPSATSGSGTPFIPGTCWRFIFLVLVVAAAGAGGAKTLSGKSLPLERPNIMENVWMPPLAPTFGVGGLMAMLLWIACWNGTTHGLEAPARLQDMIGWSWFKCS